ncbi:MAG: hypothetical protein ACRD04_03130 [Terriglobales bacterium]
MPLTAITAGVLLTMGILSAVGMSAILLGLVLELMARQSHSAQPVADKPSHWPAWLPHGRGSRAA